MGLEVVPNSGILHIGIGGLKVFSVVAPAAPVAPWYLAGGVAALDCVAAYQPKGSSSLASSYVNLNGASHLLTEGTAAPTLVSEGWQFNGSSQFLWSDITPIEQNYSMIVRYSGMATTGASQVIAGSSLTGQAAFYIRLRSTALNTMDCANGTTIAANAPAFLSGVYALAGRSSYRDAVLETNVIPVVAGKSHNPITIGAQNQGAVRAAYSAAIIQAIAIYSVVLSPEQVSSITAAMLALEANL